MLVGIRVPSPIYNMLRSFCAALDTTSWKTL